MKKACVSVAIVTFFVILSSMAFAQAQAPKEIPIGFVIPISGQSATVGAQIMEGVKIAVEQINTFGGVASLGGAKLKPIFTDSQSKPDVGSSETERLIKRENVPVICGAFNSAVTFPATVIAERYKTPWVVISSVKDEITERGFKYIFRPVNKSTYDVAEQMGAIKEFTKETGKGPKTIGLLYEGTDWGRSHNSGVKKIAKEMGIEVVMDEPYPPGVADFSAQILKIKAKKPDTMIVTMYTSDQILFSKQYMENKLDFPFGMHSVGAGAEDPAFYKAVPPAAYEYMFVQEDWQIDMTDIMGWAHGISARTQKDLGYPLCNYVAQGYMPIWIVYDALERAGSLDRDKIRDALAKTNITSGPALIMGYQKIAFDEQGQNTYAHGVISQNQKGKHIGLFPMANRAPGAKVVWPIPPGARDRPRRFNMEGGPDFCPPSLARRERNSENGSDDHRPGHGEWDPAGGPLRSRCPRAQLDLRGHARYQFCPWVLPDGGHVYPFLALEFSGLESLLGRHRYGPGFIPIRLFYSILRPLGALYPGASHGGGAAQRPPGHRRDRIDPG